MAVPGGGVCNPFGDVLMVEFCTTEHFGRLPSYFRRLYPTHAPMNALLIDPLGNLNTVLVDIIGNHFYFTEGWASFGKFYGIDFGANIRLVYVRPSVFELTIRDFKGVEWIYPPFPEPLEGGVGVDGVNMGIGDEERLIADNMRFPFSLVKFVSFSEYTGDVFTLPMGFYVPALIDVGSVIYIVDEFGKLWPCHLRRGYGSEENVGVITNGWARFCRHKGIQQYQRVMFAVAYPKSNRLHYLPGV